MDIINEILNRVAEPKVGDINIITDINHKRINFELSDGFAIGDKVKVIDIDDFSDDVCENCNCSYANDFKMCVTYEKIDTSDTILSCTILAKKV